MRCLNTTAVAEISNVVSKYAVGVKRVDEWEVVLSKLGIGFEEESVIGCWKRARFVNFHYALGVSRCEHLDGVRFFSWRVVESMSHGHVVVHCHEATRPGP